MNNKNSKNNIPVVPIEDMDLSTNRYRRGKNTWNVSTLIDYVKDNNLQPFEVPLAVIPLWDLNFDVYNMDDFIFQVNRTLNANYTKYPIILDDFGQVADGWHRICKAILDGKKTIKAYRITEMPKPDIIEETHE